MRKFLRFQQLLSPRNKVIFQVENVPLSASGNTFFVSYADFSQFLLHFIGNDEQNVKFLLLVVFLVGVHHYSRITPNFMAFLVRKPFDTRNKFKR